MYIEKVFIENFIINYILMRQVAYINKKIYKISKIIIAAALSSFYVCVIKYIAINKAEYLILNILVYITMTYIAFDIKNIKEYLNCIFTEIYLTAVFTGAVIIFLQITEAKYNYNNIKILSYIISYCILKVSNELINRKIKLDLTKAKLTFDIEFNIDENKYNYKGFVDTCNNTKINLDNKNILFLDNENNIKEVLKKSKFQKKSIEIKTATGKNIIEIWIIDKIIFNKNIEVNKIPVAVLENKIISSSRYNSLIGYDMYLEYLGGYNYD
ncbi:MAG: sigma-E processing peptidase SpoIIGA [Clostridia bacterium]